MHNVEEEYITKSNHAHRVVHIGENMANKEDIKWNEGGGVNYSEYILLYRFFFSIYSGNVVLRKA